MNERETNQLTLRGRLQVETALNALAYTGLNPDIEATLRSLLAIHASIHGDKSQDDFYFQFDTNTALSDKNDIIRSLEFVTTDENILPSDRMAYIALREIL